jgi:F0F1-type ATP synthase membrane subunit a
VAAAALQFTCSPRRSRRAAVPAAVREPLHVSSPSDALSHCTPDAFAFAVIIIIIIVIIRHRRFSEFINHYFVAYCVVCRNI